MTKRFSLKHLLIAFVAVAVVLWAFKVFVDVFVRPSDLVSCEIVVSPPDTYYQGLVVDDGNRYVALKVYLNKLYYFAEKPKVPPVPSVTGVCREDVQWKNGRRYGVVTKNDNGEWRVYWFDSETADPLSLFGTGHVEFVIDNKAQGELADPEVVQSLGYAE